MGLPRDRLIEAGHRNGARAEQDVETEPDDEERDDARIAQRSHERGGGHAICRLVGAAKQPERPAALKHEADRRRHEARNCRRASDHRLAPARMGGEMRGRPCRGGNREERNEARGAEAARHRRPERQQPHRIDGEMHGVAVDERVGDEGPDIRRPSTGKHAVRQRVVVAHRNEREGRQQLAILLVRQPIGAQQMHEHARHDGADDHGRHIEDRFGALGHAGSPMGPGRDRGSCPPGQACRVDAGTSLRRRCTLPGKRRS